MDTGANRRPDGETTKQTSFLTLLQLCAFISDQHLHLRDDTDSPSQKNRTDKLEGRRKKVNVKAYIDEAFAAPSDASQIK